MPAAGEGAVAVIAGEVHRFAAITILWHRHEDAIIMALLSKAG